MIDFFLFCVAIPSSCYYYCYFQSGLEYLFHPIYRQLFTEYRHIYSNIKLYKLFFYGFFFFKGVLNAIISWCVIYTIFISFYNKPVFWWFIVNCDNRFLCVVAKIEVFWLIFINWDDSYNYQRGKLDRKDSLHSLKVKKRSFATYFWVLK